MMKTCIGVGSNRGFARKSPRFLFTGIEALESRIAPAYSAVLTGSTATFTGDTANDDIIFTAENGMLKHNRATAGDTGFASDFDFDSTTAGVQSLAAADTSAVSIIFGTGSDTLTLGGDGHASLLKAAFSVVNIGANADQIIVNDGGSTTATAVALAANAITGPGINVQRSGDAYQSVSLVTGSGNDTVTLSGPISASASIDVGAGDDVVTGGNGLVSQLTIFGGAGNDRLTGGDGADLIFGGAGFDTIIGARGNDIVQGQDGSDTFIWNPGDGSDTIDGGNDTDVLLFNGANIAENIAISPNGTHVLLTRDVAAITMDLNHLDEISVRALGGADNLTVNDLSGSDVRVVRLDLSSSIGSGDGAVDSVTLNGSNFNDTLRITTAGGKVQGYGMPYFFELSGAELTDQLSAVGGGGLDDFYATPTARSALNISLNAESGSSNVPALHLTDSSSIDVGKTPNSIASISLLGAGTDLVIANSGSNTISVLLNNGDGTFLPEIQLATKGKTPKSVAIGDFNGDGLSDIAVTNSGSGNVSIFTNLGNGTFSEPALIKTGKSPGLIRSADLNGDGLSDLVMITGGNTISTLLASTSTGFADVVTSKTGGKNPRDLALADLDGDGDVDVAVANSGSNNVGILTFDSGAFGNLLVTSVGKQPQAIAAGDFDSDGRVDLAVGHGVSHFVGVLRNVTQDATLAFARPIKLTNTGRNLPGAIVAADVDLDGKADLVFCSPVTAVASVLINRGDLAFDAPLRFELDDSQSLKSSALVVTDLNEDGRPDIAISNPASGDISLLLQRPGTVA